MSQKYFSMFLLVCVLLTACAAQQPVAPTATFTLPPTSTLIPTETPTPSMTPEAPLPEGPVKIFAEKLKGTGYEVHQSETDKSKYVLTYKNEEIPELSIDATGKTTRTYIFENPAGQSEELTTNGLILGIKVENIDVKTRLNLPGWIVEDGKWTRKNAISPEVGETKTVVYTYEEFIQTVLSESEKLQGLPSGDVQRIREETVSHLNRLRHKFNQGGNDNYILSNDVEWHINNFPNTNSRFGGSSNIFSTSGEKIATVFVEYCDVGNYTFAFWEKADGSIGSMIVDVSDIYDSTAKRTGA